MFKSKSIFIALFVAFVIITSCKTFHTCSKQQSNCSQKSLSNEVVKPKLVVGIVVDQMRYDYIYRFWNKYSDNGFKRLVNKGYFCENTNYNYVPTYTGPGHASIFTGTTPKTHGIIANDYFSKAENRIVYCTLDDDMKTVGSIGSAGKMSPKRMLTTTITDELRLATNFRSKTIGISIKDRGAILPAGHLANAAYWLDGTSGNWITSSYYMNELPKWVQDFNALKVAEKFSNETWNTLLPISDYTESIADDNDFEKTYKGKTSPTFPYNLKELKEKNGGIDIIKATPFGNTLLKDFAIQTLKSEGLGKSEFTDMITISFSSTDYVGHTYGPESIELEDTYLRLDRDLAELIDALEAQVGNENLLLFLTADHGGVSVPSYLQSKKVPTGYFKDAEPIKELNNYLQKIYGIQDAVLNYSNEQVFLDISKLESKDINIREVRKKAADFMLKYPGIAKTMTADVINENSFTTGFESKVQLGFNTKRSGDVTLIFEPSWVEHYPSSGTKGTTHGSPYSYDTHVPLIWYGGSIRQGSSFHPVEIVDIAPTISSLLKISFPNGTIGKPINWISK